MFVSLDSQDIDSEFLPKVTDAKHFQGLNLKTEVEATVIHSFISPVTGWSLGGLKGDSCWLGPPSLSLVCGSKVSPFHDVSHPALSLSTKQLYRRATRTDSRTFSGRYVVGLHLSKHHIFWQSLLHPETFEDLIPLAEATDGMVCDLLTLLRAQNLPLSHMRGGEGVGR